MFVLQKLFELLLIPKLGVTGTAQCLEIFYVVGFLATTHSPRFNVMDVNGNFATYLARNEVAYVIAKMIEVSQCVFLQIVNPSSFSNSRIKSRTLISASTTSSGVPSDAYFVRVLNSLSISDTMHFHFHPFVQSSNSWRSSCRSNSIIAFICVCFVVKLPKCLYDAFFTQYIIFILIIQF